MQGEKQGIQQGIQQGLQQGELMRALANARNMLSDAVPAEQVAKWTSLPLEQVLALKEETECPPVSH